MVRRYVAGASNLPFFPIRSYYESDIPEVNASDRADDVAVRGRLRGLRRPAAEARRHDRTRSVPTVTATPASGDSVPEGGGVRGGAGDRRRRGARGRRRDPPRPQQNGILHRRDAVVEEPFACHPSFAQGYYDRDNAFYLAWDATRGDLATSILAWSGSTGRLAHRVRGEVGAEHWASLKPGPAPSGEVDYGNYA